MERQYEGPHEVPQPARDVMTAPPDAPATAADAMRPLDPRVRVLWWISGAVTLVVALVVAVAIGLLVPDLNPALPPLLVLAVGGPLTVVVPWLRYRRWRFALREHDLWIRRGVVWRSTSVIPYARLQFVDTTQGPLDRMFGLSQLVVHTAAPGTSGQLPGLAWAEAEGLREQLARVRTSAPDV